MPTFPPLLRSRRLRVVLTMVFVVLLLAVTLESRRRAGLYWYDVGADQTWEFGGATTVNVELGSDGFALPDSLSGGETAVLALEIRSTLPARWFEPSLELTLPGGESTTHYFERGARGRRHVVLGPLGREDAGATVRLRGEHLSWVQGTTRLALCPPPPGLEGRILVLAPHPDDAEIAAFGLYATTNAWVVTVSAGQSVDARMEHLVADPRTRSRLKGELRSFDSVTVPRWGDVPPERAINLGYFNLALSSMYAEPERVVPDPATGDNDIGRYRDLSGADLPARSPATSTWLSLVEDLEMVLDWARPDLIVAPHPALDASADHRMTTVALLEALGRTGGAGRRLLTYTNHASGTEYFPFGPASGAVDLPPWTGDPLGVDGVVRVPLDSALRLRKLYAIEAQHDLRPAPAYAPASPVQRVFGELGRTADALLSDPTDTFSYLRRAPRPNEIFLLHEESNAMQLIAEIEEWLTSRRQDRDRGARY